MGHQESTGKLRIGAGHGSLHRLVRRLAFQSESSVLPLIFGKSRHNIVASEGNTVVYNSLSDFQFFRHAGACRNTGERLTFLSSTSSG